jgi:predicted DNA-binding WGR domain protein/retron-type reverse transcriptase
MSLLAWLKHKLLGTVPARDVSRLEGDDEALDTLTETVDVRGGPLKPGHRRLALRDRRLLPKPRAPRLPFGERKKILPTAFAARLFSPTFLTRNRRLRDLLPDEEQLKRLNLPVWRTEEEVAAALGLTPGQLRHFSIHRERERICHYVTFSRKKRSGGERIIMAPKRRLKAIQRQLLALLVDRLPVTDHAHGFRRARSVRSGALPHVGRPVVLHLDLQDFFPTVTFARVRGFLIACGYGYPVATTLAVLMTEARRQPVALDGEVFHVPVGPRHCVQGAPTSPGLCNALVAKLDRRLAGLGRKFGLAYTRYADDLTFSGEIDAKATGRFLHHAALVIAAEGFQTNAAKTRVMRRGQRQRVTGVTVNQVLGLSRRERRKLRAGVHQLVTGKPGRTATEPAGTLRGKLAYLSMLNPEQAAPLLRRVQDVDWAKLTPPRPPKPAAVAPAKPAPPPSAPAAPLAPGTGRRFEYVEGTSRKFWIVAVEGSELVVHFGRIDTKGQVKRKTFPTPEAAAAEREKLIREKTGKGYTEKGG